MQMLCISISFIHKHILTYYLVECNLNTSMDKYKKYHDIFDIFDAFKNIVKFSNPHVASWKKVGPRK